MSDTVPISQIVIGQRHRSDMGDLAALAESIRKVSLLQPIGINEQNILVFGERRLRACRDILGWTEIPARVVQMARIVDGEYHENEMRKSFNVSERVAIGKAIEDCVMERRGRPATEPPAKIPYNCTEFPTGIETREIAAKRAGFDNYQNYRRAKKVVEHAIPELVTMMDEERISVSAASAVAAAPPEKQQTIVAEGPKAVVAEARRANMANARAAHRRKREMQPAVREKPQGDSILAMIDDVREMLRKPFLMIPILELKKKIEELRDAYARSLDQ